jgi:hypothetical protein
VANEQLEQVSEFTHLGAVIIENENCGSDIRQRISKAAAVVGRLGKLWKNKSISRTTKMKLYETLVVPVFMYGAECWTTKADDERKILAAEMGWLRKSWG